MKRILLSIAAIVVLVGAAQPVEVAATLEAQGFFVEAGSGADPEAVENAVTEARFAGGDLSIAVLATEPSGGAPVFADNTLDAMGGTGTVFVVAPETVAWASQGDVYSREQLDAATDASLDGATDTEVVELFVSTLIDRPVGGAEPGGGGGLPWGWIILGVIVLGGVFIFWRASRSSKEAKQKSIDQARSEVKRRLDAVANDIIDLEDEVSASDDPAVPVLYASATEQYAKALGAYEHATVPQELLDMAEDLDMAIWRLDSVEALLDGQPMPPKPEKPQPTAPPPAGSPLTAPPRVPPTTYRRPNRSRSSGTTALMTGLLMGSMGSRRRSARPSSTRSSGSSTRSRSSSSGRMRGGGRRRG